MIASIKDADDKKMDTSLPAYTGIKDSTVSKSSQELNLIATQLTQASGSGRF
jgi:hypothetical protein